MINAKDGLLDSTLRHVIKCGEIELRPYDRYGEPRGDMDWFPLSGKAGAVMSSF